MTTPIRYGYGSVGGGGSSSPDATKADKYTTQAKTASFTAAPGFVYLIDSTSGAVVATLPAANIAGQTLAVKWSGGSNTVTIQRAGSDTIGSATVSAAMALANEVWEFVSSGSGQWNLVGGNKTLTSLDGRYAGRLTATATKTTTYTAAVNELIPVNAAGGPFTVTLPAANIAGSVVAVRRTEFGGNAVTISRAGSDTIAGSTTLTLGTTGGVTLVSDGAGAWTIQTESQSLTGLDGRYAGHVDVQTFVANGTWTKPSGARSVVVTLIAAGAGGGSGRRGAAGSVRCGGGAGGGGGYTEVTLDASTLTSTVAVTVGSGGTGGAAVTVDDTNGAVGSSGGATIFGVYARAYGGTGGGGGTASAGTAGTGGIGSAMGGSGGGASGSGGAGNTAVGASGAPGSGGGGGITSANVANAGGTGIASFGSPAGGAGGAGGAVDGAAPGAGGNVTTNMSLPGGGAGGGAASITTAAQTGGAGGLYGAPGGGGGASLNGNNSGAGGAGAGGILRCVTYF